jgi:hypothetical protein
MTAASRRFLLILLLIAATGDQWAVMQSAAWFGMFVNSLRKDSIPQAVTETFDGKHPCQLCKAIAKSESSQKKTELMPNPTRVVFLPLSRQPALISPECFQMIRIHFDTIAQTPAAPPLTPPPRAACA